MVAKLAYRALPLAPKLTAEANGDFNRDDFIQRLLNNLPNSEYELSRKGAL